MKKLWVLTVLGFMISILTPVMFADFYSESESATKGMPGMGGDKKEFIKTYNNGENMRMEHGNVVTIIKLFEGKSYELDIAKKTYSELDLNKMLGGDDEASKAMQEMMKKMVQDIKVEKTTETKVISGYNCIKYLVSMMGTQSEYWVTNDVKGYKELRDKAYKLAEKYKDNQLIQNTVGIGTGMEKIDGYPIQTHVKMGSIESTNTVIKLEEKKLDASLFEIPSDFALIEKDFQKEMKMKK